MNTSAAFRSRSDPLRGSAAVLLASSRSAGNTRALVDLALPPHAFALEDLASLRVGYYSYEHAHDGDDFLPLLRRMLAHELWILATPVYWFTMSAQAKTFVDRMSDVLTLHKAEGRQLRGKALAVLCTGSNAKPPPAFDTPLDLTCRYLGMRYLGMHYAQFNEDRAPGPGAAHAARRFVQSLASPGRV